MTALRLQILGPLRLWRAGVELDLGPHQQRCLLAILLVRAGRPIGTSELVDLVWGAEAPTSAVNIIHKYVGALRRLLEPGLPPRATGSYLLRHGTGYRFMAQGNVLDLVQFRQLVATASSSVTQDRPSEALNHYLEALRLCHGAAGGTLADSATAVAAFASIDTEFFDAVIAASKIAVSLGRATEVLKPLRLAAEMGELNEPVHAALMTALAAAGYQADALATYRRMRGRLIDELGIEPGAELQEAHRRTLVQAPTSSDNEAARPVPYVRLAQLPPDLPTFVGRTAELTALNKLIAGQSARERSSPLVLAMDGMGGVGKSTLALHFAHQVAEEFVDGQLYLDLQGHRGAEESVAAGDALLSLLYALGVPASSAPDTLDARVGVYRSLTAGQRLLILLDNARDAAQVRPLLPNSPGSLVLVTSRRALGGLAAFDGAHLLHVELPDLRTARDLLERRLPDRVTTEAADDVVKLCGRLPLALAVLAARIAARPRLSLTAVASELQEGADRLAAFSGSRDASDPRTTFSWSYNQLSADAARLFRFLSVSLSCGVTVSACASLSGRGHSQTRRELDELTEAALVIEHDNQRFGSHVLVRAYAQELFESVETEADRRAAVSRLLQYYLHSSYRAQVMLDPNRTAIVPLPPLPGVVPEEPGTYDAAISWFAEQVDLLKEAVRLAAQLGYGIVPWQLALTTQQYLQWAGYFQDWEDIMRSALPAARKNHDTVGEAHLLRSMAGARWSIGAHADALRLLRAALHIYEQHGMRFEQALVHSNMQTVLTAMGCHEEALAHGGQALDLRGDSGEGRAQFLTLLENGKAYAALGRLGESAQALQEALEYHLKVGRGHEEAEARIAIAANLAEIGHNQEAIEQLKLAVERACMLGNRPNEFDALRDLAQLLIRQRDSVGARRAYNRARLVMRDFQGGGTATKRAELLRLAAMLPGEEQ